LNIIIELKKVSIINLFGDRFFPTWNKRVITNMKSILDLKYNFNSYIYPLLVRRSKVLVLRDRLGWHLVGLNVRKTHHLEA
jgi:hypothetical protein